MFQAALAGARANLARVLTVAAIAVAVVAMPAAASGKPSRPKVPASFAGVNFNFYSSVNAATAREMASGGVRSVLFGLDWSYIERNQGAYDWAASDKTIGNLADAGIEPIPVLYGTPTWATDPTIQPPPANANREPPNTTPPGRQGWINFVTAAAQRYGPGGTFWQGPYPKAHPKAGFSPIHTWQVWNEENLATYFAPQPSVPMYADLVRISHDAITGVDPDAQIALGGLPCKVKENGCVDYLQQLYSQEPGIQDYFDLVGLHPYGPSVDYAVNEIKSARAVMRQNGDGDTRIWVSELGWGSEAKGSYRFEEGPKGQAKLLRRAVSTLARKRRSLGIWRMTWFTWRDARTAEGPCEWCNHAGLIHASGKPKPSWRAFQNVVGR
jgi:hypothetical protein